MSIPTFTLSDGHSIPALAYGVGKWFKYGSDKISQEAIDTITLAIGLGVPHIDGAEVYNTDRETGTAIINSGKPRSELFITDKYFSGTRDFNAGIKSKGSSPYEALKASLGRLQLEYVDLYLLHSQHITKETHGFTIAEAWKDLERLKDEGLAKSIGVSNFDKAALTELLDSNPKHKPVINQIEYSPLLQNQTDGIVEFSRSHGLLIEGYAPLSPIIHQAKEGEDNQLIGYIKELATKYSKSESQIVLRWVYQQGVLAVTASTNPDRIKSYFDIFKFELTKEEQERITHLGSLRKLQTYHDLAHN